MTRREGIKLHRMVETYERSEQHFDRLGDLTGRRWPERYTQAISYLRVLVLEGYRKEERERAFRNHFPDVWAWLVARNARAATRRA